MAAGLDLNRAIFAASNHARKVSRLGTGLMKTGSVVFSKNLTGDILSYPEFRDATLTYMDIDRERLGA